MGRCIHDSKTDGPVASCKLGMYGGSPAIGVCKRSCSAYNSGMRGVGDLVAKATSAVGIKPCSGCKQRQEWLNEKLPFGKSVNTTATVVAFMRTAEATIRSVVKNPFKMDGYTSVMAAAKEPGNIIVWGGNWPRGTPDTFKANALFIENGLINQSAGFYLDRTGYAADSQIRKERLWETVVEEHDKRRLAAAVKGWGWELGQSCDPSGPIIVALQRRLDTGCYRFFPKNPVKQDPVAGLLEYCSKYLPKDRKVLIRPHPRYKPEWENKRREYVANYFQPNWEVNLDGGIYPLLLTASALVTVNSTVASEALALNLPIATLGESVWTGSGATLECAQEPDKLAVVLEHKPDMERRMSMQSAILRRQVPYGNGAAFAQHPAYLDWVNNLQ